MKKLFLIISLLSSCSLKPALCQIDPLEFPPGYKTGDYSNVATAIQQLQSCPVPRYKAGNTLLPNYNVIDPIYFGDYKQPGVTDNVAVDRDIAIQTELCTNYNYPVTLNWFGGYNAQQCNNLANTHPQWKCCIMSLRAQTGGSKMWNQNFPDDHYLQDSQGRFLDWDGNITAYPYKVWRPTALVGDYSSDGDVVKNLFSSSLSSLTRKVDLVNEDGEVYPLLSNYAMDADPVVKAARIASGLSIFQFLAKKVAENDRAYSAKFMSLPQMQGAKYTEYRMDGHREYQLAWEQAKFMMDPINGRYYPTGDFYTRWPNNWKDWISAWHGLKWVSQSRYYEIATGDKLFSEFVAAGWDANPENNMCPAQWLGLMKILGLWGCEWYYTSFFNEYTPPALPPNPKSYAWQAVIPPYAQAVTSHMEDILRNGDLLAGDQIDNTNFTHDHVIEPVPYYLFNTGASNKLVSVRKKGNEYWIVGVIENSSNVINSTPLTSTATFNLNGRAMTINISRKGNSYYYNEATGVFYQIDGWHESTHPSRWSKDIEIEAEVNDNTTGTLKTYAAAAPDYRNYQTVVALSNNQVANYSFTTRDAGTKYLFVKANGTGQIEETFDSGKQLANVSNGWVKLNLSNVSNSSHTLSLKAIGTMEIDSISVTSNANKYPVSSCVTPPAVITSNNSNPCNGDTVILSISTNQSYLWAGGMTTQSITVTNGGSYWCTVTTNGCTAISQHFDVIFHDCPRCLPPTDIYIENVDSTQFLIHWTNVNPSFNTTLIYVKDNAGKINIYKKDVATRKPEQKSVKQLKSKTQYNIYLKSVCAPDTSAATISFPVTTK